jgi:hypothetical protein
MAGTRRLVTGSASSSPPRPPRATRRGRLNWLCSPIYVFREGSVLFVRSYNTDYEFELP